MRITFAEKDCLMLRKRIVKTGNAAAIDYALQLKGFQASYFLVYITEVTFGNLIIGITYGLPLYSYCYRRILY